MFLKLCDFIDELWCIPSTAEFVLNNAVRASTGLTLFFVNSSRHPRVPALLAVGHPTAFHGSTLGGVESDKHRLSTAHGILSANVVT